MTKEIVEIEYPKSFLDSNPEIMEQVVFIVRDGFERELDYNDIYLHATSPDSLYLLMDQKKVLGMASYNRTNFATLPALVVEGISLAQEAQRNGMFSKITNQAINGESLVCLRTQSPRMYRALEKYCTSIFPGNDKIPDEIRAARDDLAIHLGCESNEDGIVKEFYGGLFYGKEPRHEQASMLFSKLGVDLEKGDALLCVGVR